MKLSNMKVKTRLLFSFAITIVLTLIIAFIGLTALKTANRNLNAFVDEQLEADTAVKMCRIDANNAARTIRDMYIDMNQDHDAQYKAKVNEGIQGLEDNLAILKRTYTQNDGLVAKYESAINRWVEIGRRAVQGLENGQEAQVRDILINECSPALEEVISIAKELDASTDSMTNEVLRLSLLTTNVASYIILIALGLGVALGAILALRITSSIVSPLRQVEEAALNMSKGILTTDITYHGRDDIGKLAQSMRDSLKKLSSYIQDIDSVMSQLAACNFDVSLSQHFVGEFKSIEDSVRSFVSTMSSTLQEINHSSQQVSGGSEQVASAAQALSQGAAQQAAAVQQLSATITEISGHVQRNAANAQNANKTVDTLSSHLMESNDQMEQMTRAMEEISSNSSEIGKIIKTIEDIAFQTNILALNAAVEAARAGAAGKGFAVVADEVRNLASKSAEASQSTAALIERSLKAVEYGSDIAGQTANSLLTVVGEAKEITSGVNLIAQASAQQAQSIVQVTQGIDQISGVVQTNSATAQESAASSQELSSQAQTLKILVSKFKLGRGFADEDIFAPAAAAQSSRAALPAGFEDGLY